MTSKHQIGLIFGKFYPLHCGHIYLIEKAMSQVDELHIFLGCEATRDKQLFDKSRLPKQPQVSDRYSWLQKSFKNRHNIHVHVLDEADIAFYPNGWKDWSDRVKIILADHQIKPTVVFTSEPQDVENHERYFGCPVTIIDAKRDFMNISATQIRENPYKNWFYIAQAAKPFFVKRVAIIGQYKFSTLPMQLANIYNTQYVSNGYVNYIERELSKKNNQHCLNESDYIKIAMLHAERLSCAEEYCNKVLFTSIDFQTLAQHYQCIFQKENQVLEALKENFHFDLVINEKDLNPQDTPLAHFQTVLNKVEALFI